MQPGIRPYAVPPSPQFKIDAPKSLASLVAQRLREAIIDGEFALGAMIPEESLAASFGVSRTPVREALNQLQLAGLVVIRPQRGSYVFEPSEADIAAICEFRCLLEPRAAELAYQNERDATAAALQAAIDEAAEHRPGTPPFNDADKRFHQILAEAAGNELLLAFTGWILEVLQPQLIAKISPRVDGAEILRQHRDIQRAVRRRQVAGAEKAMRAHIAYLMEIQRAADS